MADSQIPVPATAKAQQKQTLTLKQKRFVEEYLLDLNASAAYLRAGYAGHATHQVISSNAAQLLADQRVAAAISERMREICARLGIRQEHVVREYARVAFADARRFFAVTATGVEIVPSDQWTDDDAAVVAEAGEHRSRAGTSIKIKLHDKLRALDKLAIYTGLIPQGDGAGSGNTTNILNDNRMQVLGVLSPEQMLEAVLLRRQKLRATVTQQPEEGDGEGG